MQLALCALVCARAAGGKSSVCCTRHTVHWAWSRAHTYIAPVCGCVCSSAIAVNPRFVLAELLRDFPPLSLLLYLRLSLSTPYPRVDPLAYIREKEERD